jgi:hypothetical protein
MIVIAERELSQQLWGLLNGLDSKISPNDFCNVYDNIVELPYAIKKEDFHLNYFEHKENWTALAG